MIPKIVLQFETFEPETFQRAASRGQSFGKTLLFSCFREAPGKYRLHSRLLRQNRIELKLANYRSVFIQCHPPRKTRLNLNFLIKIQNCLFYRFLRQKLAKFSIVCARILRTTLGMLESLSGRTSSARLCILKRSDQGDDVWLPLFRIF